jgi:acyl carrier protein
VDPGKRIDQIAEIDSLSLAEIASGLDDAFGIRISTESLVEATTVGDLIAVVESLVAARKASTTGS